MPMPGGISISQIIAHGWPILSVLLGMSLVSLFLILERFPLIREYAQKRAQLDAQIKALLEQGDRQAAYDLARRSGPSYGRVYARLIATGADAGRESLEKELWCAVQETIQTLERNIVYLGTIASTAPFVGLLGTVIGVIRAFGDMGAAGGGGFDVVSTGIAEALVATATGLFVAIPAVIGFNYLNQRIQSVATSLEVGSQRLINNLLLTAQAGPQNRGKVRGGQE